MNAISYDMNFRYCYSSESKIDMSSPVRMRHDSLGALCCVW